MNRTARPVGLVVNPVKVDDPAGLVDLVAKACADLGRPAPLVRETTETDAGAGAARELLAAGAERIIAAGGDGTVRCVAQALAGTAVPLGIISAGTANLLAVNLGLPQPTPDAVRVALTGRPRRIDLGVVGSGADRIVFTVMAGLGFDAAMASQAPEGLKARLGWPAYLVGAVRGLRRPRVHLRLQVDDGPPTTHSARTIVVGNCGTLPAGLVLLPDAVVDDGLLDVAVVAPRRVHDWVVLIVRGWTGRQRRDPRLQTARGRRVRITTVRPESRQVDGDVIGDGDSLDIAVLPAALTVLVEDESSPA